MSAFIFRSSHVDPRSTRLLHLCFYIGALLLTAAGVYSLYVYFTSWTTGDDNSHLWQLALGIVYLAVAALVAYATFNHGGGETPVDRYAEIKDGCLVFELDQISGRQELVLADVANVSRPSVREVVIEMKDGTRTVVPIYLIDEEDKQLELVAALHAAAA